MIFHKLPIAFARTPQAPLQARGYAAGLPAYPGAGPAYIISCSNNWQCPGELPLGECQPNSYGWLGCQKCGGVRLWQSLDMWLYGHLWTLDRWKSYQMEIPWKSVKFCQTNWRHLDFPMGFWSCSQRIASRSSTAPPGRLATSATLGITSVTGAAKVAPKPGEMARHGIPLPSFNGHFREFDGEILDIFLMYINGEWWIWYRFFCRGELSDWRNFEHRMISEWFQDVEGVEQKDFENGSVETMDNHAWKIALRDLAWEDHTPPTRTRNPTNACLEDYLFKWISPLWGFMLNS